MTTGLSRHVFILAGAYCLASAALSLGSLYVVVHFVVRYW